LYLRALHHNSKGTSMHSQFEEVIKHFSLNISLNDLVQKNEEVHTKNVDRIGILDSVEDVIKILKANDKKVSICSKMPSSATFNDVFITNE